MVHDLAAMKAQINERTRLVFIANPNNPTGTTISKADFEAFLEGLPSHVVVVQDEAYYEYATTHRTRSPSNTSRTTTYCFAYLLQGVCSGGHTGWLRSGAARTHQILAAGAGPFNVNTIAQVAAIAALADQEHIADSVQSNALGRQQLQAAFDALGLEYIPSQANFVLVNIGIDAAGSFNELLKRGVIVRTGTPFGLDTWLRVTVGTPEMNDRFIRRYARF
jgi:histidinol-phosphate aminotransferase